MTNVQHNLDIARQKIASLDLEPVIRRMMHVHYWPRKNALAACEQYRNFLFLCKKHQDIHTLPPSYEIDEIWHNHILHTRKYQQDITDIFGDFKHHDPHHGNDNTLPHAELLQSFDLFTQELYRAEFGDYIESTKPNILEKLIMWVKFKINNPYTSNAKINNKEIRQE